MSLRRAVCRIRRYLEAASRDVEGSKHSTHLALQRRPRRIDSQPVQRKVKDRDLSQARWGQALDSERAVMMVAAGQVRISMEMHVEPVMQSLAAFLHEELSVVIES